MYEKKYLWSKQHASPDITKNDDMFTVTLMHIQVGFSKSDVQIKKCIILHTLCFIITNPLLLTPLYYISEGKHSSIRAPNNTKLSRLVNLILCCGYSLE